MEESNITLASARRDAILAVIALFAALAVLALLAVTAQPYGDDFCYGAGFHDAAGLPGFVADYWRNWSGRWATSALRWVVYSWWGATGAYWNTTLLSSLFIVAGFLAGSLTLFGRHAAACTWAAWASLLFISIASDIAALAFWRTAMLDYTVGYLVIPVALAASHYALESRGTRRIAAVAATVPAVAMACGLSELFVLPVLAYFAARWWRRGADAGWLVLVCVAVVATAFNLLSPGQAVRMQSAGATVDLAGIASGTALYGLRLLVLPGLALFLASQLPPIGRCIDTLAAHASRLPAATRRLIAAAVLGYPFLVELALFWSLGAPGPGRAHNVPLFALVVSWPLLVSCLPMLRPRLPQSAAWRHAALRAVAMVVLLGVNHAENLASLVTGRASAHARQVEAIRAALTDISDGGESPAFVLDTATPITAPGDFLDPDPRHWVNRCVARYYGVKAVFVRPALDAVEKFPH